MTGPGNKRHLYMPFIFAFLLVAGIFIGRYFFIPNGSGNPLLIYPQTNKLEALMNLIEEEYVDTIDRQALEENIIPKILTNLDPHSVYIPAKHLAEVNQELEGNFGGIGVQFNVQNDTVLVVAVISGGPSEKVGILPGDRIVKVNDTLIAGIKIHSNDVMKKLRGKMGTQVKVSIKRRYVNELIDFEITRGKIPLFSVDVAYMVNEKTGYIKIDRFAQNTYQEFITGLAKLKANNCQQLIIDLRNNSGGLLDVAFRLTNEFLKRDELIFYTQGKSQPRQEVRSNGAGSCQDTRIVVLLNEFSASASEILAGAIQDNDRGLVIGRRSFGKGLVQSQIPLPDGSAVRLTVARYHTPSGRCIQKPYENGNSEDYYRDIMERYQHGEFFEKDSIEQNDSLKYYTKSGREVFGGGGIMPDIFVARDTSLYTDVYYNLRASGTIYQYALQYADDNRETLKSFTDATAIKEFLDKKPILQDFIAFAKGKSIPIKMSDLEQSKELLDNDLKAYIARNTIDNEGFFPIIHRLDNVFQQAVTSIDKDDFFEQMK